MTEILLNLFAIICPKRVRPKNSGLLKWAVSKKSRKYAGGFGAVGGRVEGLYRSLFEVGSVSLVVDVGRKKDREVHEGAEVEVAIFRPFGLLAVLVCSS